jgi:CHAT domain-containing protein/Tfp pilus assembly protein PilF
MRATLRWLGVLLLLAASAPGAAGQPLPLPGEQPDLKTRAAALDQQGLKCWERGEQAAALAAWQEALTLRRRLYPQGHHDLGASLTNVGAALEAQGDLAGAEKHYREALALLQRLHPQGHRDLTACLNNLAVTLQGQGDYRQAEKYFRECVAAYQQMYPQDRYPQGHPDLARTLSNLGFVLQARGEYPQAEQYYRQALTMCRRLFPAAGYPRGHPLLAYSLTYLGFVRQAQGDDLQAEEYFRESLAMRQRLYPEAEYRHGHPDLALSLNNLAMVLQSLGRDAAAEKYLRDSLAMYERLYPQARYPRGHPMIAGILFNLAILLEARADFAEAEATCRKALAMFRQLYPPSRYPQGHPHLSITLRQLGRLCLQQKAYAQAEEACRESLAMRAQLFAAVAAGVSEVEALNLLAHLPDASNDLLLASARSHSAADATYALLWRSRGAVARLLQGRRQALAQTDDPDARQLAQRLLQTRRELAPLLLTSATQPAPGRRLEKLIAQKESLERQLAALLPALKRQQQLEQLGPNDLASLQPPDSAVIDLYRWYRRRQGDEAGATEYSAFVLLRGQPVRRVDLGAAGPIDNIAERWRQALGQGQADTADGDRLRRQLWEPLAAALAASTRTVYLVPAGPLTTVPWAALPGRRRGTVLLEDRTLALAPHAQFLLEQLAPGQPSPADGTVLVVGGLDFSHAPSQAAVAVEGRLPAAAAKQLAWPALPGTAVECERILEAARTAGLKATVRLAGRDGGTQQLLAKLPEARWAHLATHGFFADPQLRSVLQLDEDRFATSKLRGSQRRFLSGARSPLVLSGLVLAGASLQGQDALPDRGILTAEAIAGLSLEKMELAVLSACETGLGQAGGGEGIFGLQRAFHLAGARNVVASLWKVDDEATAALMGLFYYHLWVEKRTPLEALRQAQLALYHHPERIASLARARGPDFEKAARLPATPQAAGRAPARLWAGFVLSGLGR